MADEGVPYFLAASHTSSSDNTPSRYIDPIDQLMYLMDALQMASTSEPESHQHVQSALSVDTLALCQTLF